MSLTIDEAIELLETAKEGRPISDVEKYYKARELGIEALKRVQSLRMPYGWDSPLPGETEKEVAHSSPA